MSLHYHLHTTETHAVVVPYIDADNPFVREVTGIHAEALRRLVDSGRGGTTLTPDLESCVAALRAEGLHIESQTVCPTSGEPYMRPRYVLLDQVKLFFTREAAVSVLAGHTV